MNIQHILQATCKHLNMCPFSGCSIRINTDLPEPKPLLLISGGSKDVHGFYLPEGADGNVTLAAGQTVLLAWPGDTNFFSNTNIGLKTANATCDSGTTFLVNLVCYDFSNFACTSYPFHTARYSGGTCYDGTKRHNEIGFQVESDFYKLINVCFVDGLYTTLYVQATIIFVIGGFKKRFPRPSFIKEKNRKEKNMEKEDGPNLSTARKKQDWSRSCLEHKFKRGLQDEKLFRKTPKATKYPKSWQIREKWNLPTWMSHMPQEVHRSDRPPIPRKMPRILHRL